jgi:hypothetical protein
MGHESSAFEVTQGVRQSGILSADLYKMYVNPLLDNAFNGDVFAVNPR